MTHDAPLFAKWQIVCENKRCYYACLINSFGQAILRSETYTALSGVKSGIETIKKNIENNNFAISIDKRSNYYFKLYSSSTRILCISDTFTTLQKCETAIEEIKSCAQNATIFQ